jgi:hypothetical protein
VHLGVRPFVCVHVRVHVHVRVCASVWCVCICVYPSGCILVDDGVCVRMTRHNHPWDVEECEGGWVVACVGLGSDTIEFVDGDRVGRARLGKYDSGDGQFNSPSALALVPGRGLVVREVNNYRFQVFG